MAFYNYQKAGKGVAKGGPEKKPFFKFWELFARKFWKMFQLNLIYFAFCIPIVTFGPATAAMTQVLRKFVQEQPCFVWDEFKTAFKKNFKQSFVIGLVDIAFIVSFAISIVYYMGVETVPYDNILLYMGIGLSVIFIMMHFYIYLEIVALDLSMKNMIKNALYLVFLGLKQNVVTLIITSFITLIMILLAPYSVTVLPLIPLAWVGFLVVFNSYPVILKFIVNPYYESRGEKNPEDVYEVSDDEAVFKDLGGHEAEIKAIPKTRGKVIK